MSIWQWIVVIDLAISGLVGFGRGCAGAKRRYTVADGVFGLAEIAFLIWIVAVKL